MSFLEGGGAVGRALEFAGGGCGGGDHGTVGRAPERPMNRELLDARVGRVGLESSTTRQYISSICLATS